MKKLLTPSDWLLLGLGKALDIYQDVRDPFGLMKSYYENTLGNFSTKYTRHNFCEMIRYHLKTQNIRKIIKDNEVCFELTSRGKDRTIRKYPLLYLQHKTWDRKWRLAIYDIEEKQKNVRNRLREKLKELGFAELQKSVFISPHDFLKDIHEFLETDKLLEKVVFIETSDFFVTDIKCLANKLWGLDEINIAYKKIYESLKFQKTRDDRRLNSVQLSKWSIMEVLLRDPYLPKEFLPDDWYGDKAIKAIKEKKLVLG